MEKGKKFTAVDVIIILVVLAALAFAAMKGIPMLKSGTEETDAECTVLISNVEKELGEAMQVGDTVTMSLTEKDGGVIKDVQIKPAELSAYNSISGEYITQTIADKYDIYVTIGVKAKESDTAITVGSTIIKVGSETPVRGKGYAATGYTIDIED